MTIDCAKCGAYLTEAARLNGSLQKGCGSCGCENTVTGTVKGNTVDVTVVAREPEPVEE